MTGRKHQVTYEPSRTTAHVPTGTTLFNAAHWAGIPIESTCGGRGTCGKCKVQVLQGHAERTLHKARKALHVTSQSVPGVMPRRTTWVLPVGPPSRAASPWGDYITDTTGIDAGQSVTTSDDGTTSRAYRACAAVPPREAAQQLPDGECPDCCEPVDGPPDATCQVPRVHRVRVLA